MRRHIIYEYDSLKLLLISLPVFVLIAVDVVITSLPFFNIQVQRSTGILSLFLMETFIFSVFQIFILKLIRNEYRTFTENFLKFANITYYTTLIVQSTIIGLLIFVALEVAFSNLYHSLVVVIAILLSFFYSFIILSTLSILFIRWLAKRPYYITLAYTVASILLAVNSATLTAFVLLEMKNSEELIASTRMPIANSHVSNIQLIEFQSDVALMSFISLWIATTLLLMMTIRKGSRIKFYLLISIPLLYYLGLFNLLISNLFTAFDLLNAFQVYNLNVINSILNRPIGGAMFGIAFLLIAARINDKKIRKFMTFSSLGIILLSLAHEGEAIYLLPYPPFGMPSISFVGISSYLLLIGLYYSAVLTSIDSNIRTTIGRSVHKELSFLSNLGLSQMESQIENRVRAMTKSFADKLERESGVSFSLSDEDIKKHIEIAISEREFALRKAGSVSVYEPDEMPCGKTWKQWVELWWKWCYHSPSETSPVIDLDGSCCANNQVFEDVWFLAGTFGGEASRKCTIPKGKSLFFPVVNDIISFATDPQLKTVESLRSYAEADLNTVRKLLVKVDGLSVEGLSNYRVSSGPFEISLPLTVGGTDFKLTSAVSDGYWLFLRPLVPGKHTIEILGEKLDFDKIESTKNPAAKETLFTVKVFYHLDVS